jgi:hypothetical protein
MPRAPHMTLLEKSKTALRVRSVRSCPAVRPCNRIRGIVGRRDLIIIGFTKSRQRDLQAIPTRTQCGLSVPREISFHMHEEHSVVPKFISGDVLANLPQDRFVNRIANSRVK